MKISFLLLALALCFCISAGVHAEYLAIDNGSFETPDVNAINGYNGTVYTMTNLNGFGWYLWRTGTSFDIWGGLQTKYGAFSGPEPNGIQHFWAQVNAEDSNFADFTLESDGLMTGAAAGKEYTLEFFARNQQYWNCDANIVTKLKFNYVTKAQYVVHYSSGAPYPSSAGLPAMPWQKFRLPRYTAQPSDAGATISIEFTVNAYTPGTAPEAKMTQLNIDNVTLFAENASIVKAKDPVPLNGAINTGLFTNVSWAAPTGTYTHKVYFGTDSANLQLVYSGSAAQYAIPSPWMSYNTKYYWRVDEVSGSTTYTGDTWTFDTGRAICPYLAGDINGDCRVTLADFASLAENWLQCTRINAPCP